MPNFKHYNFDKTKVTHQVIDTTNGEFAWIAFEQDDDGICILRKVSAYDISQVYYEISLEVDKIVKLMVFGSFIYLAVEHDTIMGYKISLANPLSSQSTFARPGGIEENPKDLANDGTALWWLFPGIVSGEITTVVRTNTSGTVQVTKVLSESGDEVREASSFLVIDVNNLWVTTYTDPSTLVRVHNISGTWFFEVYEITS